jgi:uncharacterized protein YwlG (UPF0340 family)
MKTESFMERMKISDERMKVIGDVTKDMIGFRKGKESAFDVCELIDKLEQDKNLSEKEKMFGLAMTLLWALEKGHVASEKEHKNYMKKKGDEK